MRGVFFLTILLIIVGVVMVSTGLGGKSRALIDAVTK